jgi:hypothetical protein
MYHFVAAQPSFMTAYVVNAHAHVQRLVSVVRMAVVEECTAEEQRSHVCYL